MIMNQLAPSSSVLQDFLWPRRMSVHLNQTLRIPSTTQAQEPVVDSSQVVVFQG